MSTTPDSDQAEIESGMSYMQVCKQLMEVTAKMTYNQGVEKWIIHVVSMGQMIYWNIMWFSTKHGIQDGRSKS